MKTPATKAQLARSVAMHALSKHASRESDRDTLTDGSSHKVDLQIVGYVDGQLVHEKVCGNLVVGQDNPAGTTKRPDATRLLCAALAIMAKTRKERLVQQLQESGLPKPEESDLQLAKSLNHQLSTKINKRGAVSFQPVQEQ